MAAINATNGSLQPTKKTMKAQQYDSSDGKLYLNEIPIPQPESHQILVKIVCASLCHSDCLVLEKMFPPMDVPTTIGHEATGLVVRPGEGVKGFKEGDRVGFLCPIDCCFECVSCKTRTNLWCPQGCKMQGFQADGFFQEYAVVDYRNTIILPDSLDIAAAAPLFCAGVTAFHGVEECGLKPGQWMAIIGAGGLGQLGVQYAKAMGYKVIAIDIHDAQLEEAKGLGADHTFNSITDKSYVDKVVEITNGGVDAAVNFTASKKAYDSMPPLIRHVTGILMVVGVTKEPLEFSSLDIAMGRYILKGACNGTCYNMAPCIEFSAKNNIKPYVEYYRIEDVPLMVENMQTGKARGRMAVKFD